MQHVISDLVGCSLPLKLLQCHQNNKTEVSNAIISQAYRQKIYIFYKHYRSGNARYFSVISKVLKCTPSETMSIHLMGSFWYYAVLYIRLWKKCHSLASYLAIRLWPRDFYQVIAHEAEGNSGDQFIEIRRANNPANCLSRILTEICFK